MDWALGQILKDRTTPGANRCHLRFRDMGREDGASRIAGDNTVCWAHIFSLEVADSTSVHCRNVPKSSMILGISFREMIRHSEADKIR